MTDWSINFLLQQFFFAKGETTYDELKDTWSFLPLNYNGIKKIRNATIVCMKTVYTSIDRNIAEIIAAKLKAHGIAAIVFADDLGGLRPHMSYGQQAEVRVQDEDVEDALKIINETQKPVE